MKIALSRRQDERNKNVSLSQEQRILHDRNLQAHLLVLWAGSNNADKEDTWPGIQSSNSSTILHSSSY